jgi:hypothetical protein
MSSNETTLGTIRCKTSEHTIHSLMFTCGLRARATSKPEHFDVLSHGRTPDPEIEQELWQAALTKLDSARAGGSIPAWSVVGKVDGAGLRS